MGSPGCRYQASPLPRRSCWYGCRSINKSINKADSQWGQQWEHPKELGAGRIHAEPGTSVSPEPTTEQLTASTAAQGHTKPLLGTRTQHRAVPSAHPEVPGGTGWDTGVQGHRSCRDMGEDSRTGGGTQTYKHKGLGTESETQVQGHREMEHRSAGTWGWKDTGAPGDSRMDTSPGAQGCRDLCCSTTVASMHHCSSVPG